MNCCNDEIYHHGVPGQEWYIRRYQNPDGSLTPEGRARLRRKDTKWAHKNYDKIVKTAKSKVSDELNQYAKELLSEPGARRTNGKISSNTINKYNRKMAELMNTKVDAIPAPSGRVVKFVAKRGDVGVHVALADAEYDMSQLRNGIWDSGRVAYRKNSVDKI